MLILHFVTNILYYFNQIWRVNSICHYVLLIYDLNRGWIVDDVFLWQQLPYEKCGTSVETMIARNYFWSYRNVIGPTMAGALTQWLSYAWATTVRTLTLVYNFIPAIKKACIYLRKKQIWNATWKNGKKNTQSC